MTEEPQRASYIFVVLNPVAGTSDGGSVRATLEERLAADGRRVEFYETTGAEDEDIPAVVRAALARGADLVVAAGGDGTVSLVADALAGGDVPLGIVPVGTANVLAEVLELPGDVPGVAELLAGDLATASIDGMRLGDQVGLLHISVGLTSLMQRDTSRELKRRFGRLAYLYVAARWLFDFQPQRFNLVIDGKRYRLSASQVLIANGGAMGQPPFSWGPDISPDDGVIDVCVITARTFRDYLAVAWSTMTGRHRQNQRLRYFKARQSVSVNTKRPLPVQLDGELAGKTPAQVKVVRGAVRCVVTPAFLTRQAVGAAPATPAPPARDLDRERAVGEPVPPEEAARAAPVAQALRNKLSQIERPEQARQVVDELIRGAGDATEPEVASKASADDPAAAVSAEARRPGPAGAAGALLEMAAQVAATDGETRQAIEQAAQRATSPEAVGVEDPALRGPLQLLRAELLRRMSPFQAVDARLFLAINQMPHPPLANRLMYGLTTVMNGGWGWILALLCAAALDRRRGARALRQVAPPMWFATMTVEYPIKHYFRRKRPFIDIVQAIAVGRKPGTYSFPSGHSASAFAGAWLLTRHYPALAPLWYTIAALTAFSRIYLGAHYPGDVVSGSLAGTVLAEGIRRMIDIADPEAAADEPPA
ncbi:MAG TPA: diacylglycerol kinase family protein [Chloroflexaceae bacterium]|nr:diacylglycerol kinase family protein [Chloroflexaceae bacterium]